MTTQPLYESKRTIRLYGPLGARFGRVHRLAVESTAEAVRAMCVLYDGFEAYMMQSRDHGIGFAVFIGKRNIGENELHFNANQDIRIAPIIMGSKNSGLFSIILGVALIAVSFLVPGGGLLAAGLFNAGVAMALGGVVQLLSPQPKDPQSKDKPENEPNYAFNGPINTQAQGNCVPVAYGWPWTGSAVVSAGIQVGDDIFVPALINDPGPDLLMALAPEYYYKLGDASGGVCPDSSGNGHMDLTLGGDWSIGGAGVTFGPLLTGYAQSVGDDVGMSNRPQQSGFCKFVINDLVGGSNAKFLFGLRTNVILGFSNFALYLNLPTDEMTPGAQIANNGSGPYLNGSTPLGTGSLHTMGYTYDASVAGGTFKLVLDGQVIDSQTGVSGTWTGTGFFGAGEGHSPSIGGAHMSIGNLIGFARVFDDEELLDLDSRIRNPIIYTPTPFEGTDGDSPWDDLEEPPL